MADERGLILVDTKYEFGYDNNNKLFLIDEIHTPDSSRYFYLDSYNDCMSRSEPPKQLSKEFFRQWLIKNKDYKLISEGIHKLLLQRPHFLFYITN